MAGPHVNQSPTALLTPDRVFSLQQANPTLLHPCQTVSWGFVEFRVCEFFNCLEVFPKVRACFYCNALVCFASQTGHLSCLHIRISGKELHKGKFIFSVKSVNGDRIVESVITLDLFDEQYVKKPPVLPYLQGNHHIQVFAGREMVPYSGACLCNTFLYACRKIGF